MVLDLDLNKLPSPVDNEYPVAESGDPVDVSLNIGLPWESGLSQIQTTSGIESVDDEVVICSPRSFAEAKEKARRGRGLIEVIDADIDLQRELTARSFPSINRRRRSQPKPASVNVDCCINLESNEEPQGINVAEAPEMSQSVPPPKAPNFSCPVCMGPFNQETSTKCGHIFCKTCINSAIAAQNKCPTCRRKLKVKDTFRIYLPTTTSD